MVINKERREEICTYKLHMIYAWPCKWKNPNAVNDSAFAKNPTLHCACIQAKRV